MQMSVAAAVYALPLALIIALYVWAVGRKNRKNKALLQESRDAGLTEPASLHPLIDTHRCIGCAACVTACPEKEVLGIIEGRAQLIGPANCIGHGACQKACPVGAIQLVFGSETRGVDIPWVSPDFESSVPGIYIAGELGGMGLIRNAVTQGRQAMQQLSKQLQKGASLNEKRTDEKRAESDVDVVIVGAGPAGIAASLAAKAEGLRYKTLDQESSLGGTVAHFPRGKLVMTQPVDLPLAGKANFRELSKEQLLHFWESILLRFPLAIEYGQAVQQIDVMDNGFCVVTPTARYTTQKVLLAIGRRGSPRKLNIPGEELSKVVYRLIDPEQYRGQQVLVIGGGDSALEAACSLAELEDASSTPAQSGMQIRTPAITLAYRGDAFNRAKARNRTRVEALQKAGKLQVKLGYQPVRIEKDHVLIASSQQQETLANDQVIVCAGGELPTAFLKKIGIRVDTKYGTV